MQSKNNNSKYSDTVTYEVVVKANYYLSTFPYDIYYFYLYL